MPPLRFFHQLLTQQAEPANYAYIRGTSTAATESMRFIFIDLATQMANSETLNILVVNGEFEYVYDRTAKAIYSLGYATFSNTLQTIEFTEDFAHCVQLQFAFQNIKSKVNILLMLNYFSLKMDVLPSV